MRSLEIDPLALLERGDEMFAAEPFDQIVFEDPPDSMDWDPTETAALLGERPWMATIATIEVPSYRAMGDGLALAQLLAHANRLSALRLCHPSSVEGIAHLALPALASLLLYCEGSSDGDAALAAFAGQPRQLRELQIVGCGITDATPHTIASARWPLTYLAFGSTLYVADSLTTRGVMALANAASLASLTTLDLVETSIDDAAIAVLVSSPHLRAVQQLSIAENPGITDASIERLATTSAFPALRELAVYDCAVTERAIEQLRVERPDVDVGRHWFTRWGG